VFAIAITLLVLELHVPAGNEALVNGLEHEWPRYLGYIVSFTFIGGVWVAHNYMTRFVKATDRGVIRLNLLGPRLHPQRATRAYYGPGSATRLTSITSRVRDT
jgi:hypothetical protein